MDQPLVTLLNKITVLKIFQDCLAWFWKNVVFNNYKVCRTQQEFFVWHLVVAVLSTTLFLCKIGWARRNVTCESGCSHGGVFGLHCTVFEIKEVVKGMEKDLFEGLVLEEPELLAVHAQENEHFEMTVRLFNIVFRFRVFYSLITRRVRPQSHLWQPCSHLLKRFLYSPGGQWTSSFQCMS